jgi:DNA excision repair protein ERCC-3
MYVLATRGTTEEDFARRQIRHLASKGVRVVERDARTAGDVDGDDSGDDCTIASGRSRRE